MRSDGSSPRARGTVSSANSGRCTRRFIPAGAGNSPTDHPGVYRRTVHPRGRGEQRMGRLLNVLAPGSSPRARGTVLHFGADSLGSRFIPAGAGNRLECCNMSAPPPVHPRGRGEQPVPAQKLQESSGSSPRARGTAHNPANGGSYVRFIPAGAGNSSGRSWPVPAKTVHPRGRGEQMGSAPASSRVSGSSPRARGTVDVLAAKLGLYRFIPAGAGNSRSARRTWPAMTVHPRGRGEQAKARKGEGA